MLKKLANLISRDHSPDQHAPRGPGGSSAPLLKASSAPAAVVGAASHGSSPDLAQPSASSSSTSSGSGGSGAVVAAAPEAALPHTQPRQPQQQLEQQQHQQQQQHLQQQQQQQAAEHATQRVLARNGAPPLPAANGAAAADGHLTPSRSSSCSSLKDEGLAPGAAGPACSGHPLLSCGSGSSRRASLLGESGRASRRSSLQQSSDSPLRPPDAPPPPQQQQQRPGVSELPLHLLHRASDSSPPCVAPSCHPQLQPPQAEPFDPQAPPPPLPLGQQQPAQPFWASSAWSFGCHSDQNQRRAMEDRVSATDLTGSAQFAGACRAGFFAVYDGHAGHEAAEYLASHLLSYVLAAGADKLAARPLAALSDAVNRVERELVAGAGAAAAAAAAAAAGARRSRASSSSDGGACPAAAHLLLPGGTTSGSTLCALLLVDDKLHIAHVGDSRAVLGRGAEAAQLTRDHKPACVHEAARIEADDPAADISPDGYMYGELSVSRALGSAHLKRDPSKRALIPTPDLASVGLGPEDDFVLLATDGLWDKVDNAEAVAVTRRALHASGGDAGCAARALVERAQRYASSDNISVIALRLHGRPLAVKKSNSMLFKRAALGGGADSPRSTPTPGASMPPSGASTPAGLTPRSATPLGHGGHAPAGQAGAPAAALAQQLAAQAAGGGLFPTSRTSTI